MLANFLLLVQQTCCTIYEVVPTRLVCYRFAVVQENTVAFMNVKSLRIVICLEKLQLRGNLFTDSSRGLKAICRSVSELRASSVTLSC